MLEHLWAVVDASRAKRNEVEFPCFIFGQQICNGDELVAALKRFYLFTYRTGYEPLPRSYLTTDKGWGCLARASQMMLAHTLKRHAPEEFSLERFSDTPSMPFSIHQLVSGTLDNQSIFRGVYWSPTQGSKAIKHAVNYAIQQNHLKKRMEVVMAANGAIKLMEVNYLLEESIPLLLLAPIRTGCERRITQSTFSAIEYLMRSRFCVGVIGGIPNRSYYIMGVSGQQFLYLDPHCLVQEAMLPSNWTQLTRTLMPQASDLHSVRWDRIDSSMCIGFFLPNEENWEELQRHIEDVKSHSSEIFLFLDPTEKTPTVDSSEMFHWDTGMDDAVEEIGSSR